MTNNIKKFIFLIFIITTIIGIAQKFRDKEIFKSLDSALKNPLRVQILRLDSEDIVEISPNISKLTNLKYLSLTNNKKINLEDLFNKLSVLPNLRFLNLSDCQIEFLPTNISKFSPLKTLKLGNNNLTNLPIEIQKLHNLKEIIFSQHPDDFRKLSKEQKLLMLSLLPHTKILLTDYFGGQHGHYRLGSKTVRVTKTKLWP